MTVSEPEPLPGLEPPKKPPQDLEKAVRRTLAELARLGYVTEQHAARTALAVELAQIIELKHVTGKMSTIGNDARVLVELLDKIIPEDTSVDERLEQLMREFAES